MFKNFTSSDKILFIAAFLSLIFSEILYFQGNKEDASFIGIWVPSILAFGIYLKLINSKKWLILSPTLLALLHFFLVLHLAYQSLMLTK